MGSPRRHAGEYWGSLASPGGTNPGGTNPGGSNPGGSNPGGSNPGGSNPGGSNPGGTNPGGANPGGSNPGGTNPGGSNPGGTNPGGTNPGGTNPGGSNPGGSNPSGANPGGSNPGGSNPGGGTNQGGGSASAPSAAPSAQASGSGTVTGTNSSNGRAMLMTVLPGQTQLSDCKAQHVSNITVLMADGPLMMTIGPGPNIANEILENACKGRHVDVTAAINPDGSAVLIDIHKISSDQFDQTKHQEVYQGVTTSAVGSDNMLHLKDGDQSYSFSIAKDTDLKDFSNNPQSIGSGIAVEATVTYDDGQGSATKVTLLKDFQGVTTSAVGADDVLHLKVGSQNLSFSIAKDADLRDFNDDPQSIGSGVAVIVTVDITKDGYEVERVVRSNSSSAAPGSSRQQ